MSTAKDYLKEDLEKSPAELEREADKARAGVENTLDELMNQLSPTELMNQAMSMLRAPGDSDFARNLVTQVNNNPLPAILAGVSLTWLMIASKQPPASGGRQGIGRSMGEKSERAREKLSSATDTTRSATRNAAEGLREQGQHVREATHNMADRLSDAGRSTADNARASVRSARDQYSELLRERPLLVGALAVAAGAALGSLLPRSSTEDRMVGRTSDEQTEELKQRAEQVMEEQRAEANQSQERQHRPDETSRPGESSPSGAGTRPADGSRTADGSLPAEGSLSGAGAPQTRPGTTGNGTSASGADVHVPPGQPRPAQGDSARRPSPTPGSHL